MLCSHSFIEMTHKKMRKKIIIKSAKKLTFTVGLCARDVLRLSRQVGQEDGAQRASPLQGPGVRH